MEKCQSHEAIQTSIDRLEKERTEMWEAINHLRNRLPNWAVLLIAFLSGALGWALQYASTAAKIAAGN